MASPPIPPDTVSYNCSCDDVNAGRTLAELRTELLVRLGYAAQTNNPPPGMNALLTSFLQGANRMAYEQYPVLRTMRFYTWDLVQGVKFYDLDANADLASAGDPGADPPVPAVPCTKRLNPLKIEWVGLSDGQNWWRPLICGIKPEFYSWVDVEGFPTHYDIRQCIEVWPAPASSEYRLRIKGEFGLEPFAADTDRPTVDDEAVFLMALARAKAHYGQPDAANYETDARRYIGLKTAGTHLTARYIPNTPNYIPPSPPVWIPNA
jgi:hypothetical protein